MTATLTRHHARTATLSTYADEIVIACGDTATAARLGSAIIGACCAYGPGAPDLRAQWLSPTLTLTGDLEFARECIAVALDTDETLPDVIDAATGHYLIAPTLAQAGVP